MLNHFTHQVLKRNASAFPKRKSQVLEFLREHPIGVLSSTTPEGKPHGSVIYFALGHDDDLAFVTKTRTRKYQNLQHDPDVVLTCFEAGSQTTVSVAGTVEEVKDGFELNAIAGAIMSASLKTTEAGVPPITKLHAGEFAAFRIKPQQFHMVTYNKPGSKGYDELFASSDSFELHQ